MYKVWFVVLVRDINVLGVIVIDIGGDKECIGGGDYCMVNVVEFG